jgi:hypothetical protein
MPGYHTISAQSWTSNEVLCLHWSFFRTSKGFCSFSNLLKTKKVYLKSLTLWLSNLRCVKSKSFLNDLLSILLSTELHLKNVYYLHSASSNPTNVLKVIVLVIAWVIRRQSNLPVPISSSLAYNHTRDSH